MTTSRWHVAVGDRVGTRTRRGVLTGTVGKLGTVLARIDLDEPVVLDGETTSTLWRYDHDLFAAEEARP